MLYGIIAYFMAGYSLYETRSDKHRSGFISLSVSVPVCVCLSVCMLVCLSVSVPLCPWVCLCLDAVLFQSWCLRGQLGISVSVVASI